MFWSNVAITESVNDCWVWTGRRDVFGYGIYEDHYAHRLAYMLANKKIIDHEDAVLQTCNNHACCNPKHLYVAAPFNFMTAIDDIISTMS